MVCYRLYSTTTAIAWHILLLTQIATVLASSSSPQHFWPGQLLSETQPDARITVDVYGDFQCPYTLATWPVISESLPPLIASIPGGARIRYHMFEVVSHHNAYDAALAAQATWFLTNESNFKEIADMLFVNQTSFYNGATVDLSRAEVQDILYSILAPVLSGGNVSKAEWFDMFNSDQVSDAVSSLHTHAISKGVYGTPTYFVQDMLVSEASSSWNATTWFNYLDAL